ncbi:MAG: hypothetical protein PHI87_03750 [Candidatus Methanomethylophilus sp.]|nr:hypothetical protein [Methanomethylophilus sp.]
MLTMTHFRTWKKMNRKGGIEGLPLELMIIIIIATMATAILVGWMGNIETPHSIGGVEVYAGIDATEDPVIETEASEITAREIVLTDGGTSDGVIVVYVTDQDGNVLNGATVVLSGLNVHVEDENDRESTAYGTTSDDGRCTLDKLHITMRGGGVGFITVSVTMSGYGETTVKVPVIG